MKLLIFDQTNFNGPIDYMQPLIEHIDGLKASVYDNLQEAQSTFKEIIFDYLIIDFSTKDGRTFLNYVLQKNPKQKVVTLSSELISSDENCDECEINYNKRRLIKPIEPVQVYLTLKNFETNSCKYLNHFKNPKILLEDLLNRYDYFSYEVTSMTIQKEDYKNDFVLKEYIDLVNTLKHYKIEHEILDEYTIKIL